MLFLCCTSTLCDRVLWCVTKFYEKKRKKNINKMSMSVFWIFSTVSVCVYTVVYSFYIKSFLCILFQYQIYMYLCLFSFFFFSCRKKEVHTYPHIRLDLVYNIQNILIEAVNHKWIVACLLLLLLLPMPLPLSLLFCKNSNKLHGTFPPNCEPSAKHKPKANEF